MRLLRLVMLAAVLCTAWFAAQRLPTQSVPWGAPDLAAPVGLFTKTKLAGLRADPVACAAALATGDADFRLLPDRATGKCPLDNQAQLAKGLYPYSATVSGNCALIAALMVWEREVVMPAAERHLGSPVARIDHAGIFACRNVRGSETRPSQHASANAIDISGFRLADGQRVTVLGDWGRDTPAGRFLLEVRDGSCRIFRGVLGPEYNKLHRDHFHFDMGRYGICR